MIYEHGTGSTMKLATRVIDNHGYVKSYGGVQKDQDRQFQLKNKLELSQSLAAIMVLEQRDTVHAKDAVEEELRVMALSAKIKLVENNNDGNKLTKRKIMYSLLTCFAVQDDVNKRHNGDLVTLLSR
jgi:hypothetical protein